MSIEPEVGTSSFVLVLHGHLPWVNHPEHETFLEEDWLFEAIADCYLPLLEVLEGWERDGVGAAFTFDISPPLLSMLKHAPLKERAVRYLEARRTLIRRYQEALSPGSDFGDAARDARARAERLLGLYEGIGRDVAGAFARHWDAGRVELMTCGATHGLHPVLLDEGAIRAQISEAVKTHERFLGRRPRGIWLPECGVTPLSFSFLADENLVFSFTEDRAVLFSSPPPAFGVHRPIFTPEGIALFARDPSAAKEVWSAEEGYPGDFRYREFYRDLGYDADESLLDPIHKQGTGARKHVGLKLHRITGKVPLDRKEPYVPAWAEEAVRQHADHFVNRRIQEARALKDRYGKEPCITAAFDAELFGHWWFEGPRFIDVMMRALAARHGKEPGCPRPVSAFQYLDEHPTHQVAEPAVSSWGDGGAFKVWVNGKNDWLWRKVHDARLRLGEAARRHGDKDPSSREGRALRQAAREVLLASSSDWPFILTMGTQEGYAAKRPIVHLSRAHRLFDGLERGTVDEADLSQMEERDAIFPGVDPGAFA